MRGDQLGLLLWKNYIVRKRQPGILALVFLWPVFVFMILYTVRDNVDPEYNPKCQFPARMMPQDGLLPFVQSFICSVGNPCDPLSQYEEVPSYKNSTIGPLVVELQPFLKNQTVLSAVATLPKSIQLLKSMAEILTKPEIKALFDRGIRLGDLFHNHDQIKNYLKAQLPNAREGLVDGLFKSSIKLYYLMDTFGSSDVGGVICSPESLKKYLIMPKEEDFTEISKILCDIDSNKIPDILQNLSKHLDFSGLLAMVDRAMAKFREYNFFQDLKRTAETILDLKTAKKYAPEYLKLQEWVPKIILLFQNTTFKQIDLTFIDRAIEVLDPIFSFEFDWPVARHGFLTVNKLLEMMKTMIENQPAKPSGDFFSLIDGIKSKFSSLSSGGNDQQITQLLDTSFLILQDGIKLTKKLVNRHADEIKVATEILDAMRNFLPNYIVQPLTYVVSLIENVVEITHHVAVLHENMHQRIYEVSKKHQSLVQKILISFDPTVYRTILQSFSRLGFLERFVEEGGANPPKFVCQQENLNFIFDNFYTMPGQEEKVRDLLCSEAGQNFTLDVYRIFDLQIYKKIVSDTLATFVTMALKQPVPISKSNLTSMVSSVRRFKTYLNTSNPAQPDWTILDISEDWKNTFVDTQRQGRLDILGIHLSIAKMAGSRSLSYFTIKPDLENMDMLADQILQDIRSNPTTWIKQVQEHEFELIESFYLTMLDREKTLKILEYADFTRSYCVDPEPPPLLNFPKGSNATLLKGLICRLSKLVQTNLDLNITVTEYEQAYRKRNSYNWTTFNEKVIEIYQYVDTLVHLEPGQAFDEAKVNQLKTKFKTAWTSDLTIKDGWEVSVGSICKLFNVMESALFHIQETDNWESMYAVAWASSVVFDSIERVIDQIQKNERVATLSEILQDLPQTEILLDAILRNLSPMILDVVDVVTMRIPVHLMSAIDDYKLREPFWPCVLNESAGGALELRNGSREIVREIERIACNPGLIVKEWNEQPVLMRVRKIFQKVDSVQLPAFNWTLGYSKFRHFVQKFDVLLNDSREVTLTNEPNLSIYMKALAPHVKSIIDERLPTMKKESSTALDYIDIELDKVVKPFGSKLSANQLWGPHVDKLDRILILAKFLSHVVHKSCVIMSQIVDNATGEIKLLSLLGFNEKSPITIVHDRLPNILATLADGAANFYLDKNVREFSQAEKNITCSTIFEWFSDYRVGITPEEYRNIKNFTCDYDLEYFNAITGLFISESAIWREPVHSYRSYVVTSMGDLYNLAKGIVQLTKKNVTIIPPFSAKYVGEFLVKLKDSLKQTQPDFRRNSENLPYAVIIEGIAESLLYVSAALKEFDSASGELHLWQLAGDGDVRQLLRLLESHPEQAIALMATFGMFNRINGALVSFKDLRMSLCSPRLEHPYWSLPKNNHFLTQMCFFDPYQLLETITSDELVAVVTGKSKTLLKETSLPRALSILLDTLINITSSSPHLTIKSNLFNATTWKGMSSETWKLIHEAEFTWIHEYYTSNTREYSQYWARLGVFGVGMNGEAYFTRVMRLLQLFDSIADFLSGGDIWQKLKVTYENSRMKPLLTLTEDMPNIVITAVDTFVTSERITDFIEKFYVGQVHPCDIDKYLIPPNFVRKKGLLSSISNFCQKIVMNVKQFNSHDLLPYDTGIATVATQFVNETYFLEKVKRFQNTLIRVLSEGYKELKVPTWWTSFEEGTYKDFLVQYRNKDKRALAHSMVKKSAALLRNLLVTSQDNKNCSWCSTLMMEIVNSQLSQHALYAKFLCQMNRLNVSEMYDIMLRDFNWQKTSAMIKDFRHFNKERTITEFVNTLEITLHYIADIIVDFQNTTYHERITQCYYKYVGGPTYSRPGLYISLFIGLLDTMERNVQLLDMPANHEHINNLSRLAAANVAIWMPLKDIVKKDDVKFINEYLPNATINVNSLLNDRNHSLCKTKAECANSTILYNYLSSKRAGKVLRYDLKAARYPSIADVADHLAQNLDLDLIDRQKYYWRRQASFDLTWLKQILQHLAMLLGEGSNLLDVASKIDFENVSNVLGVPDLVDGVVNLLKDKTVDKLFDAMKELLEDVEPFFEGDKELIDDLYSMIVALESMEIFKNLGLLDMKYVVSKMFDNWDMVRSYLIKTLGISNEFAQTLSEAKIDMISVFLKERKAISLMDTICSPQKLGDMLNFTEGGVTAEEVSPALCQLSDSQTQNVTITLMKNLNFDYIFKTLMSANVKSILSNANLTEADGKSVLDNLGVAGELIPFFKDKLSSLQIKSSEPTTEDVSDEKMSSSNFLKDSSEMLCGKTLISDNGQLYKIIASIEDNSKEYDKKELDSLPTEFCRETYKSMVHMPAGKIIWAYVKPLLRGQILYAPNTTAINRVMHLANDTFVQMDHFSLLLNSFEQTLSSLANLTEMGDSLRELQDIMSSDVMKIAIKSMSGGNIQTSGGFSDLNLSEIAWRLKKSKKMITMVGMLNDLMGCVLVDRVRGFATEEDLEMDASLLTDTNEFLAAVVFMNEGSRTRSRRSVDSELPNNVTYKIRMDVDYVPSTRRLKTQFWLPGPEASFIEDLRYLRGFIQLQDAVDRAIIKVKSQRDQEWRTLTQQMPYPCWKHAPFQQTLYESQGVQVCFFFALMMCVGAAVRHIVWERESQNSMVMSVMGLKPWRNTLAWFITSFVELAIVMASISLILLAGKILPHSDPLLVLILLVDYIFSIVTFGYMISTIFSSASLSAITTVVMFLLTYMPYIIVIAMEAAMGLGYKLLICLSMSTSFCYGCLYAVRKEVQGTGLQWGALWEESSPGDSMSLGVVLLMIAIDGCIYAAIGFLIDKYTNSGRGFHGLRSRSLWWADTRSLYGSPSYLAFVNNLYFTNDVLHPSATYQEDESDVSNLRVSEKEIGVRFESVRKVYHTERGDIIAVDDFTLKLCEGEVTSLLGRNGAGKTTIIKMLTGMLAPTSGEISLNGEEGCKPDIGVCPQDNVLIGTLTPREHMIFYWKLKRSTDRLDMEKNVNDMLLSLELGRQEHEPVSRLSGGTRRRLCVALAFLGSPKLVILDEPGAGVDPAARRRIWRLIDHHRIGRTVILSTHHLDEADMLSDTVVVMHKGRILCTGSPLSLKMTHGRGYRLHVSFPARTESTGNLVERKSLEALRSLIEDVVPNSTLSEIGESEVIVTLPFQGKHGADNDIAQAAKVLEDNRKLLGFSHFSLECDTLERVFLDLCARADNGPVLNNASQDSIASIDHIGLSMPKDDIDLIDIEVTPRPSPLRQVKALLKKRLWHFAKDWRAPLAALILPTMFVAVAMGFSLIRPPSADEPPLVLTPNLYNTHPTYFYSIDNSNDPFLQHVSLQLHDRFGDDYAGAWQTLPNDTGTCECEGGQQKCHGVSQSVEGLLQTLPGRPTLDWIVGTHQEYIEKRYGGWSLSHFKDDPLFVVWYNNKGHHALPSYLNALNEAILRASGVQGHLTTLNHPLKLSSDQLNRTTLLQHVADVGVALVLLVAFSLVGAQGAKELVRERLSEEKRILYLAGVHPVTYWTTALIWDLLVFGCSICLAVIVFEIFGLSAYVARDNLPGVCLLLFLFAWAAIPFCHVVEKVFDDSSLSNMVLFCVNTFIGVASLATILVIDILGKTKAAEDAREILHHVLMIFPQYALGDALVQLSRNDITSELLQKFHMDTYQSPLGWELLGIHFVSLALVGAVLFLFNLIIECRLIPELRRQRVSYEVVEEDDDVARERMRIEAGHSEDVLQTVKLRKEYRSVYGTNVAVQNLSLGVSAGKCFGLLGVNGAGKSTTFKMLTTEIIPTAGRIILRGSEVGAGPLCNGEVGYCPQSDALDSFLTPHQCLTIHGEVCGLNNVPRAVELSLKRFDLLKYAHQRVSSLSGGNKRKLCAALSVMAPVPVVLMDEPTSGMDPATKDFVARAVQRITKNQGCVILTSHSVAECENLCSRVGILAKAGLRCIGTPQHLKHKFGEGYIAFLRFSQPVTGADLRKALSKHIPEAVVSSRQATAARLLVPRSQDMALSVSFAKVKQLAEELKATDYTVTQSSLDQVLVNFSEELEDETIDISRYNQSGRNNYPSIDNIHMETF